MLYYEWKKIWVKPGTKIAMLILAVLLFTVCWSAVHNVYCIDENGDHVYGIGAISKLKEQKKEWAGVLTEEVIAEVIKENARINETEEYLSDDVRKRDTAYGWKLGFHDIRYMIMYSFCKFREGDYYKPDTLKPEDASRFYENRLLHLKEWLDEEPQQYKFSEDEREFLIERYEAWETPLEYDWAEGWKQLFELSSAITMIMMLTLSFVVAGIFSGEFSYKADSIFYSSYHGRGKAVAAKIGASFLFITSVYFGMMFLYTVIILGILGTDGAGLTIQTNIMGWKSFYYLTNLQEYQLIVLGGYIGTVFILFLTMLVSALTRSTALAATIPFILIFMPSFIGNSSSKFFIEKLISTLPDRLLDINQTVSLFYLYHIGGKVVGPLSVIFPLYAILSLVLIPLLYRIYSRKESK